MESDFLGKKICLRVKFLMILSYFINMKNTSRKPYIYKVTNLETHQYYIGSQCIGKTIGHNYFTSSTNKEFKESFKTYGEEKYKIEIVKEFEDPDECGRAENYMIRDHMQLKDGLCLNRACCCSGEKIFSRVGTHLPEETKQKMSEAHKGRPSSKKGTHLPEETKQKISRTLKGTPRSEETKEKISRTLKGRGPNKGTHLSEETKEKISKSSKRRIKISIEGNVFDSLTEASKYYNVHVPTIRNWLKKTNITRFI